MFLHFVKNGGGHVCISTLSQVLYLPVGYCEYLYKSDIGGDVLSFMKWYNK